VSGTGAVRRSAAVAATLLAVATAGCGIRSTDVPVDGGPAPTRATCDVPTEAEDSTEVYLVCGSRVESVQRAVDLSRHGEDVIALANALLDELRAVPAHEEQAAGFRTDVPPNLEVTGPVGDGPEPELQLSQGPGDLPVSALVQIICTFAHSDPLGDGEAVVLSGPPGSSTERPKSYACSATVRASPGSAHNPGLTHPAAPPVPEDPAEADEPEQAG
jgi:hypothetical protein